MMQVNPSIALAFREALTPREAECLYLVACGHRPGVIASRLSISLGTVRGHVEGAREKLHARTVTHAVALALRDGAISYP